MEKYKERYKKIKCAIFQYIIAWLQLHWKTYGIVRHLFPVAQMIKNPPAMQETWVQSLGWEDPLEKEIVTHSYILA